MLVNDPWDGSVHIPFVNMWWKYLGQLCIYLRNGKGGLCRQSLKIVSIGNVKSGTCRRLKLFRADNQLHHYTSLLSLSNKQKNYTSSLSRMFGYDLVKLQREVLIYIQMIVVDDTSVLASAGACFRIMSRGGIMEDCWIVFYSLYLSFLGNGER